MTVGRTTVALALAVVLGLILGGFGFTWPFVIAWSLIAATVGCLIQLVMPLDPHVDAPRIAVEPDRRPTDISRMAWALNTHTGLAGPQVTRRVREILRHRLIRQGIDPDAPDQRTRRDALIGRDLWERLSGQESKIVDVESALAAIERLGPVPSGRQHPDPATTAASDTPTLLSPFRRPRR